ncbi:PREDICTED: KH domain-containing, RNA-binding, signal transduction-associated protein 2-like isoform X1 [Trachymyrmex cornetzi]|uniref:KH domain-containing, RNA-binding, signal transduction-associated protein 2-like isoform X1 n=1 Tax=Trachymyrmex cornetzi TaxID=471704 RepID=UPI00084F1C6A|nr:PREDICTED: KH domain-containing, RNA-binding, signal transduction-associated protein 2-like isoform X1 [Trachymyrmex cornetzi]XP_018372680.1 PREDICTED: KH domain-containing, RNA-binding, signal transduction-associated protein 2-like isoform X1 [Trachymyrmex cornetzi]XP_018372681.1 PREDICTED: KH domain-containing, RNA-binding, signal transduction-associated protein 2-like isoform X1 [Trachymyrmex cornetzi]
MDMNRSSNGDYKYQRDEDADDKPRSLDESEKDIQADKAGEYMNELLQEKIELDGQKWPNAIRLLDQEIQKTETLRRPMRESKYVDIYREKHVRVSVKVLVPIREHPKFNFVGKLLGPKGNSMKRLQEETMCKMAVLGRGSMKDKQKEEELRASMNLKYAHLADDLHVEITAIAPPAEAYARIAFALAEVRKYLIPDNNDNIRQEQMREMEMGISDDTVSNDRRPSMRGPSNLDGNIPRPAARQGPRQSRAMFPPPVNRGPHARGPAPSKSKVFSILDRARAAMDQGYNSYDSQTPATNRAGSHDFDYHGSSGGNNRYGDRYTSNAGYTTYEYDDESAPHSSRDYYESSDYADESSSRAWKSYKTTTTSGAASRYRTTPYTRPSNIVANPLVANLPYARRPIMPNMQKPINERNRL